MKNVFRIIHHVSMCYSQKPDVFKLVFWSFPLVIGCVLIIMISVFVPDHSLTLTYNSFSFSCNVSNILFLFNSAPLCSNTLKANQP